MILGLVWAILLHPRFFPAKAIAKVAILARPQDNLGLCDVYFTRFLAYKIRRSIAQRWSLIDLFSLFLTLFISLLYLTGWYIPGGGRRVFGWWLWLTLIGWYLLFLVVMVVLERVAYTLTPLKHTWKRHSKALHHVIATAHTCSSNSDFMAEVNSWVSTGGLSPSRIAFLVHCAQCPHVNPEARGKASTMLNFLRQGVNNRPFGIRWTKALKTPGQLDLNMAIGLAREWTTVPHFQDSAPGSTVMMQEVGGVSMQSAMSQRKVAPRPLPMVPEVVTVQVDEDDGDELTTDVLTTARPGTAEGAEEGTKVSVSCDTTNDLENKRGYGASKEVEENAENEPQNVASSSAAGMNPDASANHGHLSVDAVIGSSAGAMVNGNVAGSIQPFPQAIPTPPPAPPVAFPVEESNVGAGSGNGVWQDGSASPTMSQMQRNNSETTMSAVDPADTTSMPPGTPQMGLGGYSIPRPSAVMQQSTPGLGMINTPNHLVEVPTTEMDVEVGMALVHPAIPGWNAKQRIKRCCGFPIKSKSAVLPEVPEETLPPDGAAPNNDKLMMWWVRDFGNMNRLPGVLLGSRTRRGTTINTENARVGSLTSPSNTRWDESEDGLGEQSGVGNDGAADNVDGTLGGSAGSERIDHG